MKRDLDLIRLIHLKVEDDYDCAELINLKIDGYSAKAIAYNSQLAFEAGYLSNCSVQYADNGVWTFSVGSLTWEGHDFLDRIRDDSRWGKIKKAARDRGGCLSLPRPLGRFLPQSLRRRSKVLRTRFSNNTVCNRLGSCPCVRSGMSEVSQVL